MTVLPIVARELRVVSRRAATYWTRFTFALLAMVVASFVWAIVTRESPRHAGFALFVAMSVIAYIYVLLAGAIATADSVSEEKREGTLGLLFLTDLKGYDIVLGKLVASSVSGVYGLLAIFPIMAVPLLLGGVAPAELWRVMLACVNGLFLSLAVGMLCSAHCKDERKSIGLTLFIMVMLTGGLPGLTSWLVFELPQPNALRQLFNENPFPMFVASPGFQFVCAFDDPYKEMLRKAKWDWFYTSAVVTHLLGWAALVWTARLLPRIWQDRADSVKVLQRRERWKGLSLGSPETRAAFRRQLLEVNPFYWLAARDRFKEALVWVWIGLGAVLWMGGLLSERRNWLDASTYVWTALLAHSFFKCWVAMEASRRLGLDRRSGALELLLSTPLGVPEILQGQWLALLRQFGVPVALVCAVDFLFLGLGLKHMYNDRGMWVAVWISGITMFLLDLATLTLVSMWLSLKHRRPAQAGVLAIVRVCVLPWVIFGALGAMVAIWELAVGPVSSSAGDSAAFFLGTWVVIGLVTNLVLGGLAWQNLRTKFREVAMERADARPAFWARRLGKRAGHPAG